MYLTRDYKHQAEVLKAGYVLSYSRHFCVPDVQTTTLSIISSLQGIIRAETGGSHAAKVLIVNQFGFNSFNRVAEATYCTHTGTSKDFCIILKALSLSLCPVCFSSPAVTKHCNTIE